MKKLLFVLLIVAFFVLIKPFLHLGFPFTHDGENHLARIANYTLALKQGQFPPRWAPTFWGGYGYPVFNYNYPLANIAAAPLLVARVPVEETLKIIEIVALAFGAVGVYLFLRSEYTKEASVVGVIAYLTAPFLFNNLYVRGAVGEVLAYAVFPHVLVALRLCAHRRSRYSMAYLFFSTFALMLAHNIFVLLLIPLAGFYLLSQVWKLSVHARLLTIGTFGLGISASMFFWLPALLEKSLVSIDGSSLLADSINHFPLIQQLLFAPYTFGYSYQSPVDGLSFSVGFVSIISVIALVFSIALRKMKPTRMQKIVLVLFVLSVLMMLPQSRFVWQSIPILHYLQFPWRLLFVTSLLGAYLTACFYTQLRGKQKWFVVIGLIIAVVGTANKHVDGYVHNDDAYYYSYAQTSTVLDENKPKTLTFKAGDLSPQTPLFEFETHADVQTWNGSRHVYTVNSAKDQQVVESTAYFPGWQTTIDGKAVEMTYEETSGRISYTLPAGQHTVKTMFTQNTLARMVGNILSFVAFLGFGLTFFWLRKERVYGHEEGRKTSR